MTVALPLPYEDELLYNNIGRYMELLGIEKPTTVIKELFGRMVYPSADLLCGLGDLARQTHGSWGLSSKEISDCYTPLPYYASYATDQARAAAYGAAMGNGETKAAAFLGHAGSRVVRPLKLRFCGQCAREDIANHGEAYWRRSFQLPGVVVCPKHRVSLRESGAYTRPRSSTEWYAGNTLITALLEDDSTEEVLWNGNPHLLEVARRSIDLLAYGRVRSFSAMNVHYLSLARAAGLTRPSGLIDVNALSREMKAMYGEDFLNATGLSVSAEQELKWLKDMMARADASHQPLQHILLSHLLECCTVSMKKRGQEQLTERQNFTCPNPYAAHAAGHVIEFVKMTQTAEGRIGRAQCSCGLKFSFRRCRPGTTEPEIVKVSHYGNDWRKAAQMMKRNGMPYATIAREMGVPACSVKAMVADRHTRYVVFTKAHVLEWRREWELLLEGVAPLGHVAARKLNYCLYYRLNRHDAAWLRESGRRCRTEISAGPRRGTVDWAVRDKVWSEALRTAATNLYSSVSRSTRVSRTALISEARVPLLFGYQKLHHLPLCSAALAESEESIEKFMIFRLRLAARFFFDEAESITSGKLLRGASIRKDRVTPLIQTTADQLVDEIRARSLQQASGRSGEELIQESVHSVQQARAIPALEIAVAK